MFKLSSAKSLDLISGPFRGFTVQLTDDGKLVSKFNNIELYDDHFIVKFQCVEVHVTKDEHTFKITKEYDPQQRVHHFSDCTVDLLNSTITQWQRSWKFMSDKEMEYSEVEIDDDVKYSINVNEEGAEVHMPNNPQEAYFLTDENCYCKNRQRTWLFRNVRRSPSYS